MKMSRKNYPEADAFAEAEANVWNGSTNILFFL